MKTYDHQFQKNKFEHFMKNSHYLQPVTISKSHFKERTLNLFSKNKQHTPKSINELNLSKITSKHAPQNRSVRSHQKLNPNLYKNDFISQNQLQSNKQTIRQSIQSVEQSRVKQRGFSLQYLKMTKKHKIKELLSLNSDHLVNAKNNKVVRSKTMFQEPSENIEVDNMRFTQHENKNQNKVNAMLGNADFIRGHLLLNKTLNDLKLPKTTTFYNRSKKIDSLMNKFKFADTILPTSTANHLNYTSFQNTPIGFVPIESGRLRSERKLSVNKGDGRRNSKTLKKSKYSPFKSRSGSATSHNQDMNDIVTKEFSAENQFQIKPMKVKNAKKLKLQKHKRFKTDKENAQQENQLSLIDDYQTIRVISQGLYGQIKLLHDLKECFQTKSSASKGDQIPFSNIAQLIKLYVFGQKTSPQKYKNRYFSQIDSIFEDEEEKAMIRKVICCQRLLIVCIVDLFSHEKLTNLVQEVKLTIVTLLIIYLVIWKQTQQLQSYDNIEPQIDDYIENLLKTPGLKTKSPIEKHLKTALIPYVDNLFRYSKQLFEKQFKKLIEESKLRTISRTFYETLKKYAIYLTYNEEKIINKSRSDLISNFATCPAPYILSKPEKRYTLCVDLDQTLLYSKFSCPKKFETSYRPGAKEFIIQLNKYFEIIVFTSSIKQYADQVIKPFVQFVDHTLYRYHVTRGKNLTNTVKDLSRIGRRLEKVIFIDDLQCNIKLQPENSIKVTPWKGNMNDKEIIELKALLLSLGKDEQEHEDVRKVVSQIKQKLQKTKKQ